MRRVKLRYLLFLLLLFSGIIPLLISSWRLIAENRDILETHETVRLTTSAQSLAQELSEGLAKYRSELRQLGRVLLAVPDLESVKTRLGEPWVEELMRSFFDDHPDIVVLRLANAEGYGLRFGFKDLSAPAAQALTLAFQESSLAAESVVYRFAALPRGERPLVAVAVLVEAASGERLIAQALVEPPLIRATLRSQVNLNSKEIIVVDRTGQLLWSGDGDPEVELALMETDLVSDFVRQPISVTRRYNLQLRDRLLPVLARVSPVAESGWVVVAHMPAKAAFVEVEQMAMNTLLSSLLLVALASVFALAAARWLSRPIQRLTDSSHQIAQGHFHQRIDTEWVGFEIAELADDFNRMSDHVESYVEQLKRAAEANRELFISSIRAFAAAIDAKDPYTRGHSERVAAYSRAIARHLGLPADVRQRVWISAVLHDVGKIGVDDRVLKKGGVLTAEEFEQMKLHPVVGAEIVEPISDLRQMIPGIRWHHEAWNGSGYPDGLKGDQIPLMARIIAVADTFDAITTNRPYQNAYTTDYALDRIKQLTGTKFDAKIVTAFLLAWEAGRIKIRPTQESASQDDAGEVDSTSIDLVVPSVLPPN